LDVATNDVIALAMLLHRQRLENFEFTSHERCWYRRKSIRHWSGVRHSTLWREVVHLTLAKHHKAAHEENVDGTGTTGTTGSTRPGSHRGSQSMVRVFFVFVALFIDLLTDKVQPLSRAEWSA